MRKKSFQERKTLKYLKQTSRKISKITNRMSNKQIVLLCSKLHHVDFLFADINNCVTNPCKNGGSCEDLVYSFNCTCAPGYNGTRCEIGKYIHHVIMHMLL